VSADDLGIGILRLVFDRIIEPKMTRIPKLPSSMQKQYNSDFPQLICGYSQRKLKRKRIYIVEEYRGYCCVSKSLKKQLSRQMWMDNERNTYCNDSHRNIARPLLLNAPNLSSRGENYTH
jgi:hypothetical protein